MRARPNLRFLLPILLLGGCGGETLSDYNLKLVPHALQGQDPFKDGRVIKLMIQEPDGQPEFMFVGPTGQAELEIGELPPMSPGTTVGILVEEDGGESNMFNVELAVAWGSNVVDGGLALGEEEHTLDILVPELNKLGDMGTLPASQKTYLPGVAMVGGEVFLFGGASDLVSDEENATNKIFRMSSMDAGDFSFDKLDTTMPTFDDVNAFFGTSAIAVRADDKDQILVTGGRVFSGNLPGDPTDGAFLFDPETEEITWGNKAAHARMNDERSEHRMLLMDNDNVVIYGGMTRNFRASFEIFKPGKKRFDEETEVDFGEVESAGTSMGPQGAMICGGANLSNANTTIPTDGCTTINLQGLATPGPSMVTPVSAFAMTRLGDGRVLAAGGVTVTTDDNGDAPASDKAWILDGNTWTELPATLNFARAHHQLIPLPNGNALLLGGTETGGGIFPSPNAAVVCPELFDANTNVFVKLDPCTNSGSGAWPQWAIQEGDGLFVLSGYAAGSGGEGGDAYGFVAFTPEL